jgi:hypothetical protein
MVPVYGEACFKTTQIKIWAKRFIEGRRTMCDDERSGRPSLDAGLADGKSPRVYMKKIIEVNGDYV